VAIVTLSDVAIRPAESADVAAIARLYLEVAPEVVAREPSFRHVPDLADVEHRYSSRIRDDDRAVLVAVVSDALSGFVDASFQRHENQGTYTRTGDDVYIEELIVTASTRRRGIGTALMHAIEEWGHGRGARMIWLDTHLSNEAARAMYAGIGYREVGVELVKQL
jgi:GNAT superfamily N-acetyltransferase